MSLVSGFKYAGLAPNLYQAEYHQSWPHNSVTIFFLFLSHSLRFEAPFQAKASCNLHVFNQPLTTANPFRDLSLEAASVTRMGFCSRLPSNAGLAFSRAPISSELDENLQLSWSEANQYSDHNSALKNAH